MSFGTDMRNFVKKTKTQTAAVVRGSVRSVLNSVKYGSPITAAPGQPIGEGDLRESWVSEFTDARIALIYTDSPYAPQNEDGIARPGGGPYTLRSADGGRWSVLKTRKNFQAIIDDIAHKLERGRAEARDNDR